MAFELRLNPVRPPAHLPFSYCRKRTLTTPMNGPEKSMDSRRKVLCDGRCLRTTARSASCGNPSQVLDEENGPRPGPGDQTGRQSQKSLDGEGGQKDSELHQQGEGRRGGGSFAHGPCSAAAGDRERGGQSCGARTAGAGCIGTRHNDWLTGGAGCSTGHISCGTGGCDTRGW